MATMILRNFGLTSQIDDDTSRSLSLWFDQNLCMILLCGDVVANIIG